MRRIVTAALAPVLAAGALLAFTGVASTDDVTDCGLTTIDGTVEVDERGRLVCGPGRPLVVREDLASASPQREATRTPLVSFFAFADVQLADEESPLRGEWADKCFDSNPASGAFRPQETLVPHMMNAHVLAANRIAAHGGPVLGAPLTFATALGDLADNQQRNEIRLVIDIFDGGRLVDPDSGANGYDGVQADDPAGAGDIGTPVAGERVLDLANEPFWASGLRDPSGEPIPWYSLQGNHDAKVQGTVPDDDPAWRAVARQWSVGALKVNDLAPDRQQQACAGGYRDPSFWQDLFTDAVADPSSVGTVAAVPPDPDRMLMDKAQWMAEHSDTSGVPRGHGFEGDRCTDAGGRPLDRTCYLFVRDDVAFVAIDTNPAEGLEGGNIDAEQFAWIERVLRANSTRYVDDAGNVVENPDGTDRLIVTLAHHPKRSTDNRGVASSVAGDAAPSTSDARTGDDLAALLLRYPNVILQVSGHTHENRIVPFSDPRTGSAYWEVNTAAIADQPHQSRTIEIADNGDGTLSIFAVAFDAAVVPDARRIDWSADDPTDEIALAEASRTINEQWLAALGWETGANDPQAGSPANRESALGTPPDRNAELILPYPAALGASAGPSSVPLPRTGGGWAAGVAVTAIAAIAAARATRGRRR